MIFVKKIRLVNYPDPGASNDFTVENSDKLIGSAYGTSVEYSEEDKALMLKVFDSKDVNVTLDLSNALLNADDYTTIEIEYMMPTTNSRGEYTYQFFYTSETSSGYAEARSVAGKYVADGEYHKITVNFSGKDGWSGLLKKLRFDYFSGCAAGDVIYIKSINLK